VTPVLVLTEITGKIGVAVDIDLEALKEGDLLSQRKEARDPEVDLGRDGPHEVDQSQDQEVKDVPAAKIHWEEIKHQHQMRVLPIRFYQIQRPLQTLKQ
jgi:hypothetical protein